jgi:hypothetical protein
MFSWAAGNFNSNGSTSNPDSSSDESRFNLLMERFKSAGLIIDKRDSVANLKVTNEAYGREDGRDHLSL